MLFSLPPAALACNWLNEKVIEALILGLDAIDAGGQPAAWPDCLPGDRREVLRRRRGLRPKLESFWQEYSHLDAAGRQAVRHAISRQTELPAIFSDALPCLKLSQLPESIRQSADGLGDYLFGQLSEILEGDRCLRDTHYQHIHNSRIRTCPFCGLNYFRPYGAPRNALDHLMAISHYPFAAADLRNLPPACHECNSTYKGAADVLSDDAGGRRICSDPYAGPTYILSLQGSVWGAGNIVRGRRMPQWLVTFLGGPHLQANTWDAVYKVKSRYLSTLDADFHSWIESFATWFVREHGRDHAPNFVVQQLPRYINNVIQGKFEDRAFLKAEAFRVVETACASPAIGNDVGEWLWGFVEYAV